MAHERYRRQIGFRQLSDERIVDAAAACSRLYHLHNLVFAGDEVLPNLLRFWGRLLHDGRAAHAGLIAPDDREDLDATHVAALQLPFARTDVRKAAALPGCDDH